MNTLDFYFDFLDPFSYIAGKRFIDYIENEGISPTNVNFRSFQLKPNDTNKNLNYLQSQIEVSQYNTKEEYLTYFQDTIGKEAIHSGIVVDVEKIIASNSVHAHAGFHYAKKFGMHFQYFLIVMEDHFKNGKDYYDLDYLCDVLRRLGLDTDNFIESLKDLKLEVSRDRFEGLKIGLQVVPSFFIKDSLAFMGMGSKKAFAEAFKKLEQSNAPKETK